MIVDDIDIRRLRYFLTIAEEKHFTRAADKIGIRQPPLSIQIRQLEETVGARLFTRHAKGVELTAAGIVFQETVRDIVARFEDAVTQVRRSTDQLPENRLVRLSRSQPGTRIMPNSSHPSW